MPGLAWTAPPSGKLGSEEATALETALSRSLAVLVCTAALALRALSSLVTLRGASGVAVFVDAAVPLSSRTMTWPSPTLSPSLTSTSLTTPAADEGTSIVALSDSSVSRASSTLTLSPGLTKISITGTSAKSPISGTLMSTTPPLLLGAAA